jgi:hypothetical protein
MFLTNIKDNSSLCLYGNEGGDYEETSIEFIMEFNEDDCIEKCNTCHHNGKCGFFHEKAIIHHDIKDIDNGEEIFEGFLKSLQS